MKYYSISEAAEKLNVSETFITSEISNGTIPCCIVDAYHYILFNDFEKYYDNFRQKQKQALQELSDLSQELGF
jgi:hypothetical protein